MSTTRSFLLAIPLAAATSAAGYYLGVAVGTSPDVAFLRWEGWGTIAVNLIAIFAFWMALFELNARGRRLAWEESAFQYKMLPEDLQTVIDKKYIPQIFQRLNDVPKPDRDTRLCQAVEMCASKYQVSSNVSEVSGTVEMFIENESSRDDSSFALVRYLAWAIPSIGFIGTVMGLSSALGRFGVGGGGGKEGAPAMDALMQGVSRDLMLAFNTTFVALVLALILMYFYHKVGERQEKLFNRISDYCLKYFVTKAYYPPPG